MLPKLEQFRQRVVLHYHLDPLTKEETFDYIKHRLKKAGNEDADIFEADAIEEIYKYSKGVPRLINIACHHSLISGLVYETRRISAKIASEAIAETMSGLGVKSSEGAELMGTDEIIRKLQREDASDKSTVHGRR